MEAATPLRQPRVALVGGRLVIQELHVDDECTVRVVGERERAGEDPVKAVLDAVEIGARVLDREQTAANAEYVKTEFERASRELERQFTERARLVAEHFGSKVDEVFGPESGRLARELEKLFGDGSAASVQNRVRELVGEALVRSREDLVQRFSAADGSNPLADFKEGTVRALRQAEERQHRTQHALMERIAELEKQIVGLRDEREKQEAVGAERERGTAKGRDFEQAVAEELDALAISQGDVSDAVGDVKGPGGKTGDVVVEIGACSGPARGRIVFEAKDRRLSRPAALEELDRALDDRDADYAVLVLPTEAELPARLEPLREYNGDKLVVALDPDEPRRLALELGYRLARARVLMARGGDGGVDGAAVHDLVERALRAIEEVRKVKSGLTGAKTSIDNAYKAAEEMAGRVRGHLAEIDELVLDARPPAPAPADDQLEL
jgi:hypothetical protein